MKKAIGTILCVLGILLIVVKVIPGGKKPGPPEPRADQIQDWAVIGVLLAIGVPLSQGKKKPQDTEKK